jgi:hypothetical protein
MENGNTQNRIAEFPWRLHRSALQNIIPIPHLKWLDVELLDKFRPRKLYYKKQYSHQHGKPKGKSNPVI